MRKVSALLVVILCTSTVPLLHADIAAIHTDELPQEKAVLQALDDARQMETYSHVWSPEWNFPLSKQEVAKHLGKDLGSLEHALKRHPENEELALLTGLVGRYAYNVDVKGSPDATLSALSQAETLNPSDVRVPWFRATFFCETLHPSKGESEFLSLEASHPWDQLPAAFWVDYMECAYLTHMYVHVLRAEDHLGKLHGANTPLSNTYIGGARKHFVPFDPKNFDPKKMWEGYSEGNSVSITSTACGLRIQVNKEWKIDALDMVAGSCVASFSSGPYKAVKGSLSPEIFVLIHPPLQNETLDEFSRKFLTKGTFEPDALARCPANHCISLKGEEPGMYRENGDGHPRVVIFERDEPAYPGLIFEAPSGDPKPDKSGPFVMHDDSRIQQRIRGKLYYLVILDTAASIEGPALKDFDFFLSNLTVE
ncbi:MAG TPA: hypothetical protein VGT04_08945 [Acidobacteriaceae bacterium]|nr:hypothetical protein [Acidobacteriaceae bacterium]